MTENEKSMKKMQKRRVSPRSSAIVRKTRMVMTKQNEAATKRCCMCKEIKLFDNFYKDKSKVHGLTSRCKDCTKKAVKEWQRQNPQKMRESKQKEYRRHKDQRIEYAKQWRKDNAGHIREYYQKNKNAIKDKRKGKNILLREMLMSASRRASSQCLPFDLTIEYMETIALDHCPVTGKLLDWDLQFSEEGKRNPFAPSLDKIIPSLGYTQGNVAIICHQMNRLKSDMTLDQLNQLVDYVRRNT